MGVLLVALAVATNAGMLDGLVDYLRIGKKTGEITGMSGFFGVVGLAVGAWHMWGKHEEGNLDYYLSSVGGAIFILFIAMIVTWFVAPWIAVISKSMGPVMGHSDAAALYLAAAGTLYAAGLAPSLRRAIWVGCVMGGLSVLLLVVARDLVDEPSHLRLRHVAALCNSLRRVP